MFTQDYVLNSTPYGPTAQLLDQMRWDPGMLRPYFDKNGNPAVTVNTGRWTTEKGERKPIREHRRIRDLVNNGITSPVFNATTLRKEEWIELDRVVLRAARYPLRAWADLSQRNSFGGFNGMAKLILEHETMSDPGEAIIDMDAIAEGRGDQPLYQLQGLPLPITHADFWCSARKLAASRNTGTPFDTTMGEASGRRVAESLEKQTIGNVTAFPYGGTGTLTGGGAYGRTSAVYGYLNFPARLTKTNMTAPTAGGWTPEKTQQEFNACLNTLRLNKFKGPFMVYNSNDLDPYLDGDYYVSITSGAVAPTKTLRQRLREIDGVEDVKRLDFLFGTAPTANTASGTPYGAPGPGYFPSGADLVGGGGGTAGLWPFTYIFVQMTPDVARAVNGLDITTVQWETLGGAKINFRVMTIQVPQIRSDYYNNCGIMQATTAA